MSLASREDLEKLRNNRQFFFFAHSSHLFIIFNHSCHNSWFRFFIRSYFPTILSFSPIFVCFIICGNRDICGISSCMNLDDISSSALAGFFHCLFHCSLTCSRISTCKNESSISRVKLEEDKIQIDDLRLNRGVSFFTCCRVRNGLTSLTTWKWLCWSYVWLLLVSAEHLSLQQTFRILSSTGGASLRSPIRWSTCRQKGYCQIYTTRK